MDRSAKRPKILVLTSTYPRWKDDWEPRFVFDLCRRLAKDFEVHVLAPHFPGCPLEETLDNTHITRYRYFFLERGQTLTYDGGILNRLRKNPLRYALVPFLLLFQALAARRLMKRHHFAAIHAHWIIPQGLVALLAQGRRFRIPILCTSHGGDLFGLRGKVLMRLKRWVLSRCRHVTVMSKAMQREMNRIAPQISASIIPMGTDLVHRFYPNGVKRSRNTILFVGRLVDKKGVPQLIDAFALVKRSHPHAELLIAGRGPDEWAIRRQIKALDRKWAPNSSTVQGNQGRFASAIRFLGSVPHHNLPDLYRRATLAVTPSIVAGNGDQEGFGLVIVEALGCGCPVVASDLPAIRDILEDGVTGLLAYPGDATQLAGQICRLLENENLRASLAQEGRKLVAARFDWEPIAGVYRDLIMDLAQPAVPAMPKRV